MSRTLPCLVWVADHAGDMDPQPAFLVECRDRPDSRGHPIRWGLIVTVRANPYSWWEHTATWRPLWSLTPIDLPPPNARKPPPPQG